MRHLLGLALVVAVLAAGCSGGAIASLLPTAGPLVTLTMSGGECFDGPCGSVTIIERDGTVRQTLPEEATLGTVPPGLLTALDAAIKAANFEAIRAVPFTGECPTAFDGQEWVYEFGAPGGVEPIASCETEIDPAHPVFASTIDALVAVDVLAVP